MPTLRAARDDAGLFATAVPPALRGRWCVLALRGDQRRAPVRRPGPARASFLIAGDRFPPIWSDLDDLPPVLGEAAIVFVLPDAEMLRIDLPRSIQADGIEVSVWLVGRAVAAFCLPALRPRAFLRAMAGDGSVRGLRAALAVLGTPGAPRRDYASWVALFDSKAIAPGSVAPSAVQLVVWPSAAPSALAATIASIEGQSAQAQAHLGPDALASATADYIGLLQAGEVLAAHALEVVAGAIAHDGAPEALFADEDSIDDTGRRSDPRFKPDASHALMLSGTLTRGLWVFRRDCLPNAAGASAEETRLAAWLALYRGDRPPRTRHIPRVLTHRRPDADDAPARALAAVVAEHLGAADSQAHVVSGETFPLQVSYASLAAGSGPIALIVPTQARRPHVAPCVSAVLARTDCAFELLVVLSQSHPPDAGQREVLAPLLADPRVRIVLAGDGPFNYARANNAGAAATTASVLCLLNDDVEPLDPNWARAMAGHFADPRIGAVGAKLLFPDRTVQHGGIVMGLSGLAGHAFRGLPCDDAGYAHRAALTQEFSAVTGACLMVRAGAYAEVGGMDESFPVAFNDVAFCLSLRERGWSIVHSAEALLVHHESVSRGEHGTGPGSADEPEAARRIRARWPETCAADPFYNPNLSVVPGREWTPAFPPRAHEPAGNPARKTAKNSPCI